MKSIVIFKRFIVSASVSVKGNEEIKFKKKYSENISLVCSIMLRKLMPMEK